jgi:CRP-like cAMP-binding protein
MLAQMVVSAREVDLMTILSSGKQAFLGTAVAGDWLGVSSMLEPREFPFTAVARSDGMLLSIDATRLRQLCEEDPGLGVRLMRQIARDLRGRLAQAVAQLAGMSKCQPSSIPQHHGGGASTFRAEAAEGMRASNPSTPLARRPSSPHRRSDHDQSANLV